MATGPEHYAEAEKLVAFVTGPSGLSVSDDPPALAMISAAQVHAALALAAAKALSENGTMPGEDFDAWHAVAGTPRPAAERAAEGVPLPVWWLDDGGESPEPDLYRTYQAATAAGTKHFQDANPTASSRLFGWHVVDLDDLDAGIELVVDGHDSTGIVVRPIQPKGDAS